MVAIDGKTARRSHDRWQGMPALHVVSAWAAAQLVLCQRKTDVHSNEITAIYQALRTVGATEEQATVIATAIPDIEPLRGEMIAGSPNWNSSLSRVNSPRPCGWPA